ncbi:MAG: hypothetical protein AB7U45_10320 [Desulfamplus sp.]
MNGNTERLACAPGRIVWDYGTGLSGKIGKTKSMQMKRGTWFGRAIKILFKRKQHAKNNRN